MIPSFVGTLQAAARRKQRVALAAARERHMRGDRDPNPQSEDLLDLESGDSELLQPQQAQQQEQQLHPELRRALAINLAAYAAQRAALQAGGYQEGPGDVSQGVAGAQGGGTQQQQQQGAAAQAEEAREKRQLRTLYTEAYLQQQQLSRRVQQQQRQRTLAFWLSLATVSGMHGKRLTGFQDEPSVMCHMSFHTSCCSIRYVQVYWKMYMFAEEAIRVT